MDETTTVERDSAEENAPKSREFIAIHEHGSQTGSCCPGCRDLLEYVAVQFSRLEPFIAMFENPPPMLAGLMGGRAAKKAAKAAGNGR